MDEAREDAARRAEADAGEDAPPGEDEDAGEDAGDDGETTTTTIRTTTTTTTTPTRGNRRNRRARGGTANLSRRTPDRERYKIVTIARVPAKTARVIDPRRPTPATLPVKVSSLADEPEAVAARLKAALGSEAARAIIEPKPKPKETHPVETVDEVIQRAMKDGGAERVRKLAERVAELFRDEETGEYSIISDVVVVREAKEGEKELETPIVWEDVGGKRVSYVMPEGGIPGTGGGGGGGGGRERR